MSLVSVFGIIAKVPVPDKFPPKVIVSTDSIKLFAETANVELVDSAFAAIVADTETVTAPVYDWVPVEDMLEALIAVVPETDKSVTSETDPLNTAFPVMANALVPPATVELKVALVPESAILPVANVTAPV
jgi:hypothetical protein